MKTAGTTTPNQQLVEYTRQAFSALFPDVKCQVSDLTPDGYNFTGVRQVQYGRQPKPSDVSCLVQIAMPEVHLLESRYMKGKKSEDASIFLRDLRKAVSDVSGVAVNDVSVHTFIHGAEFYDVYFLKPEEVTVSR